MITLEEAVVRKLKTTQHILCTVESCTGGLISSLITNVSGASEVFWGASVVYDNTTKQELGLSPSLLHKHGAVSTEVAQSLAELGLSRMQGVLTRTPSQSLLKSRGLICMNTTGIAGPLGGTREKPVGLCFISLAISGRSTFTVEFHAPQALDRIQIKNQFAQKALEMIRGHI